MYGEADTTRTFALKGKKIPKLTVPRENELYQRFIVSFQKHFDALEIRLATFSLPFDPGERFYVCRIRSTPCCSGPIPEQEVERYVFAVLDQILPRGRWVTNWSREKAADTSSTSCKASAVSSLKRAAPEDDGVTPLVVTDADTRRSKRARTESSQQEEVEGQPQDLGSAAEFAIDERIRSPAEFLVKNFVRWLNNRGGERKHDDGKEEDNNANGKDGKDGNNEEDEEDGDGRDVAMWQRDFVSDLIDYQQNNNHNDKGEKLEKMMQDEMSRIVKDRRQALWRLWYCRISVQLLRLSEDPYHSETGDCHKERVERQKRYACLILNGIVNGLWITLRQRALLFYQFLAETNNRVTRVSRLGQSNQQEFIKLVLDKLSNIDFPESLHVPNPAVAIAWLRGRKYEAVCRAIGLHNLAHLNMDPEVVACESKLLKGGVGSAFEVSATSRCWAEANREQAIQEEGNIRIANRAGNDEQQHHSSPVPGADDADDVSVRTVPAPHDSPGVPIDSELSAESGRADLVCHGQVASANATGTSWDNTRWLAVLMPKPPFETINAGPQGRNEEAQFMDVPLSFGAVKHDELAVSRHGKSHATRDSSAPEQGTETAPHPSRGQQATPGVDLAGGVSVRTAFPLHNSPAAPVDSESGGRIGQADPFYHERDAVTATADKTSHDTLSVNVQAPYPIDTLGAHPPTWGTGAHSWHVPPELQPLLAAAGEDLEHGRDQRGGPVAPGLVSDAVGNAASPLQTYMPVGDAVAQPMSEEGPGESAGTEGMGAATRLQVPDNSTGSFQADWAAAEPEGASDFMQSLSLGQWESVGYPFDFEDMSFFQNLGVMN